MSELHNLLRRQMARFFHGEETIPDVLREFLLIINQTYIESDQDRRMLERSMELSSDELLQANADIRAVLSGLIDLFLRTDLDGKILDARAGSHGDLILPVTEMIGKRIQDMPMQEASGQFTEALRVVREMKEPHRFEYSLCLDGGQRHYEARMLPVAHSQIIAIIRNITSVKDATEREEMLRTQLSRSERLESLGILAGGVAHDLNNILGPLVAYPDLLIEDLGPDHESVPMIVEMQKSASRAAAMIQDLLTLARRGAFQVESVQVNPVIESYLRSSAFHSISLLQPDVRVETFLEERLPSVSASPHHLTQAVMNLVMNAFESHDDGGYIAIETREVELVESFQGFDLVAPGTYVRLSVKDRGRGIGSTDIEHIFEPFYTKKEMGRSGSGLGLSIVYGLVKDCRGYIDVVNREGGGTAFILFLPVIATEEPLVQAPAPDLYGTESVLVVDDILEQRQLAERILTRLGYSVTTVENGRAAVEHIREHDVDIILLDMIMEDDFGGLDTYREIARIRPGQRCVIASGFTENEQVRKTQSLGAGMFIMKPYVMQMLGRAIRSELDREP